MNKIIILGKTNSGKSTLFNKLIGQKESIVSKKKNTTIYCIKEKIKNKTLIDTPGILINNKNEKNKIIYKELKTANITIINIEKILLESEDFFIFDLTKNIKKKIMTINKIDKIKKKTNLLKFINTLSKYSNYLDIIPISAKKNTQIDIIKKKIINLKACKFLKKNLTKKKNKINDIIRETFLEKLEKEIPYSIKFDNSIEKNDKLNINIKINKNNYKKIIIGKNGEKIKDITYTLIKKIKNRKLKIKNIKINIKYDNKHRN